MGRRRTLPELVRGEVPLLLGDRFINLLEMLEHIVFVVEIDGCNTGFE